CLCFFFQAEDGIRDFHVTGVQTCALPISGGELMGIRHAVLGIGIAWLAACAAADREEGDTRADGAAPRAESALLVSTAWLAEHRSEERRVGKEWRRRQAAEQETRSEEGGV